MMLIELVVFLFITTAPVQIYSNPILPNIKSVKPDYKVTKFTFEVEKVNQKDGKENSSTETEAVLKMEPEAPSLQIIPLDFLCEFCQVVILKLKERRANEADFEEKIKEECKNGTDSSLCDVINRVNLDRLKNDDPRTICDQQNMCNGGKGEEPSMPGTAPAEGVAISQPLEQSNDEKSEDDQRGTRVIADNQNVNATLLIEDIAPPY